jgi:cytochrome c-type biogenesis protein CcmH/NrfG
LKELGQKLSTSEASLQRLTPLYELSLQQNESLKTYNAQITERMQERDEDLAASYEANDRKDKTILRLIVAVILLCVPYIIKLFLWAAGKFRG